MKGRGWGWGSLRNGKGWGWGRRPGTSADVHIVPYRTVSTYLGNLPRLPAPIEAGVERASGEHGGPAYHVPVEYSSSIPVRANGEKANHQNGSSGGSSGPCAHHRGSVLLFLAGGDGARPRVAGIERHGLVYILQSSGDISWI